MVGHLFLWLVCPAFEGGAFVLELGYCGVLLLGFEFVEVLSFASVFVGVNYFLKAFFSFWVQLIGVRVWI